MITEFEGRYLDVLQNVDELLNKLLNGDMDWLSDQDRSTLRENREGVIQQLNAIFSNEIPRLLEEEKCLNATALIWGFRLAAFLEASESFQWLRKLCHVSLDILDQTLGYEFVTEELAYLLADTIDQWDELTLEIEDSSLDEFIRSACIDALVFSVAKGRVERSKIADYFKSLFHRILSGEVNDEEMIVPLVSSCSDFWPGECLEEIRELFGLNLVDEKHIGIDCVLEDFFRGKESCIEGLQKQIKKYSFWEPLPGSPDPSDEDHRQWDKLEQLFNRADIEANQALEVPQRNEICGCGSGRKYKKCCMNKPPLLDQTRNIRLEESIISYSPLEDSDDMKAIPKDDMESILALYYIMDENPEEVLRTATMYIEKYPNVPMIYNFLYGAYRKTHRLREAMKLMKETLRIFPDYLFGRIEYALYLLRRGEPEKAFAALENAGTLSQLYPDRKIFHAAEWKAFAYVMGLYWIQQDDLNQAKIYLGIIQKIYPSSYEIKDLQKKMKSRLFHQSMERQQKQQAT